MAVTGKLQADFSSFYDAVTKAQLSLKDLEISSANVGKELTDMVSSYRGDDFLRQTNLAVEAVTRLGGATNLTAKEQEALNAQVTEAIAKYEALGKDAPQALLDMQKATEGAGSSLGSFFTETASGFVASIASGQLLADAIGKVADMAKEAALALPDLVEHSAELGNNIYELSLKTGASVENLSQLRYVAGQTGIDFTTFGTAMEKMEQSLGKTGSAANKIKTDLGDLGLSLTTLKNEKPDQAFIDIETALEGLPNRADQARIGMDLFGRGFKEMAGLTQDSIQDLMKQADDLGLTMSTTAAAADHAAKTGFTALQQQLEAVGSHISDAIMPAIAGLEKGLSIGLTAAITAAKTSFSTTSGVLGTFADAMGTGTKATQAQQKIFETLETAMIAIVQYGVEPLVTGFGWLMQQFDQADQIGNTLALGIDELTLAFTKLAVYADKAAAAVSFGQAAANFKADAAQAEAAITQIQTAIDKDKAAIEADKTAQADWANQAKTMNAAIEAGVKAIGDAHIQVADLVNDYAEKSKNAYGGVSTVVDATKDKLTGLDKTLAELDAKITEANNNNATYAEKLKLWGPAAAKAAEEAHALGKAVTDAVQDVADAFEQAQFDKLIAKAMEKATAEMAKQGAALEKASLKALTDAMKITNKAWDANQKELIASQKEYEKLSLKDQGDTLDARLQAVQDHFDQERAKLDIRSSNWAAAAAEIDATQELAAKQATAAWQASADAVARMAPTMANAFKDATAQIPKLLTTMLTSSQGALKSLESFGSDTVSNIATKMLSAGGALNGVVNKIGSGLVASLGGTIGGALANVIPGLGAVVGPALTSLLGKVTSMFSSAGRDAVTQFASSMGGFDELHKKLDAIGASGEQLWITLTQGTPKGNAQAAAANIKAVTDALDKANTALADDEKKYGLANALTTSNTAAQALLDSYGRLLTAGHDTSTVVKGMSGDINAWLSTALDAGVQIPAGMQPILDQLVTMGQLTDDNARKLLGLDTKLSGGTFDDITAAAARYGLQLDALGPKVNQLNIEKQAAQLSSDWQTLTSDGEDVNAVMDAMKGKVQDVITAALKFGDTVPSSMKPMIDQMINAGDLTDQFGNKLTDSSKINFETPLNDQVDTLVKSIQSLVDALTGTGAGSLSDSLTKIGNTVVNPKIQPVIDNSQIPPQYAIGGGPTLSPAASAAAMSSPSGGGGDITVNLNADGAALAQVVVPNLPNAIKGYGLG